MKKLRASLVILSICLFSFCLCACHILLPYSEIDNRTQKDTGLKDGSHDGLGTNIIDGHREDITINDARSLDNRWPIDSSSKDSSFGDYKVSYQDGWKIDGPVQDQRVAKDIKDMSVMDAPLKSDQLPAICKSFSVSTDAIQISKDDTDSATTPFIVGYDNGFVIAFVEGKWIRLRKINSDGSFPLNNSLTTLAENADGLYAPWLSVKPNSNELAAVWHEKSNNGSNCLYKVMFGMVEDGNWPKSKTCLLKETGTGPNSFSFGPASVSMDLTGSRYLISSPIDGWGYAESCSTAHQKIWLAGVLGINGTNCNMSSTLNGNDSFSIGDETTNTFNTSIVPISWNSNHPYILLRQYEASDNQTPVEVSNRIHWIPKDATSMTNVITDVLGAGRFIRPAVASGNSSLFVAWTDSTSPASSIQGIYRIGPPMGSTEEAPYTIINRAKEPFAAYNTTLNLTGLAFSSINADGEDVGISILKLIERKNSSSSVADWVSTIIYNPDASPRTPAIAPSKDGFGVVWVDNSRGQAEVFFKKVTCVWGS